MTTDQTLKHWEQLINERTMNGVKIDDWCKIHGISRHCYYYWKRRVQKNLCIQQEQTIAFAEISPVVIQEAAMKSPDILDTQEFQILYKDVKVLVPSTFNTNSLAGLMKVLQGL